MAALLVPFGALMLGLRELVEPVVFRLGENAGRNHATAQRLAHRQAIGGRHLPHAPTEETETRGIGGEICLSASGCA